MTVAEILGKAWLLAIGLGVFGGSLYLVMYRDAHHWRYLSRFYGADGQRPRSKRYLQNAVAYGEGIASKSYNGIPTIGAHDAGLCLSLIPPFSIFQKPLFIPYSEIRGWKQFWYLDAKSHELEFVSAPDVKLVMPADQVRWLQQQSGGQLELIDAYSPHKQRPNIWYAVLVLQAVMAIGLLVYFLPEVLAL